MEYNDQEYLKLFEQINKQNRPVEQNRNNYQMLKETPDYSNYTNVNEVKRQPYTQDFNINEFNIETRINGQNINEVKRQEKEDKLNEVMQKLREERLNEVKKAQEEAERQQEQQKLNESVNFHDANVVSVEMFNKARYNSMMKVANRILPK